MEPVDPGDRGRWMPHGFYFVHRYSTTLDQLETAGLTGIRDRVNIAKRSSIFEADTVKEISIGVGGGTVKGTWTANEMVSKYTQNQFTLIAEDYKGFDILEKDGDQVLITDNLVVTGLNQDGTDGKGAVDQYADSNWFVANNPNSGKILDELRTPFGSISNPARLEPDVSPPEGVAPVCGREYDLSGSTPTARTVYRAAESVDAAAVESYANQVSPWMQQSDPIDSSRSGDLFTYEFELESTILYHDLSIVTVA
jgi:hypothetical protein